MFLWEWEINPQKNIQDPAGIWTKTLWILVRNSYHFKPLGFPAEEQKTSYISSIAYRTLSQTPNDSHYFRLKWNFGWALQPLKAQSWHILLQAVNLDVLLIDMANDSHTHTHTLRWRMTKWLSVNEMLAQFYAVNTVLAPCMHSPGDTEGLGLLYWLIWRQPG